METDLNKIIIGNSGSGKTFLAQKLAAVLNVPVVHLDKLFWDKKAVHKNGLKKLFTKRLLRLQNSQNGF